MTCRLPQRLVHQLWRVDLDITRRGLRTANVIFERLKQRPAFGVPKNGTGRFLLEVKQIHFATDAAMVALLGFLDLFEVCVELFLFGESRSVDAGEHRIFGITAPIGAGHFHQLESVPHFANRRHMRAAAQIEPVALLVDIDLLIGGDGVDQLDLKPSPMSRKIFFAWSRDQTSFVKGLSRAMISRIFFSMAGRSSSVKG